MAVVVTGAGREIVRAIAEHLPRDGTAVVAVDLDAEALAWTSGTERVTGLVGSATDRADLERAVDAAEHAGPLTGWVNNAAVFRDAGLATATPDEVLDLITATLAPAVVGSAVAVRRFLAAGSGGSIVNVSSHQAQRAVRGALPCVTAKAVVEGLTRATAVDQGPGGIRANAIALGSIDTERYPAHLRDEGPRAGEIEAQMAQLHARSGRDAAGGRRGGRVPALRRCGIPLGRGRPGRRGSRRPGARPGGALNPLGRSTGAAACCAAGDRTEEPT